MEQQEEENGPATVPAEATPEEPSPTVGEATEPELTIEDLKKQLDECRTEAATYLDQWRRTAAEFTNYRKRLERDQAEAVKYYNASLITRLLPVLDDMDRAFENLPEELKGQPWVEGITLIYHKMRAILEQEGVREIETVGQRFDPTLHEAVTHEPSETVSEGEIIGEVRKGYIMNGRVLRPAQVRVSSGNRSDKQ